jgi:hypothetical protein
MRTHLHWPKVVLLGGALEHQRSEERLSSIETLIEQVGGRCLLARLVGSSHTKDWKESIWVGRRGQMLLGNALLCEFAL